MFKSMAQEISQGFELDSLQFGAAEPLGALQLSPVRECFPAFYAGLKRGQQKMPVEEFEHEIHAANREVWRGK